MSEITEKPYLILTVGLPRSGKSTWAKSSGFPIVSPDAIRLCLHGQRFFGDAEPFVWATARLMVRSLFEAGCPVVVLDACNITEERRLEWAGAKWESFAMFFDADKGTCIARARETGREDLIPVIERMAAQFEPLPEENFQIFEDFLAKAAEKWPVMAHAE